MAIDIHAHYLPSELMAEVTARGSSFGVKLVWDGDGPPSLTFEYGFRTRPIFPKLIEDCTARRLSLDQKRIERQVVATWPDIYGYGLAREACCEWHRILNNTLAAWCADNSDRFSFAASVPLLSADDSALELSRAVNNGAVAVMIPANVEGANIGECVLDPFWACAEQLNLPIILHPVMINPSSRVAKFGLAQTVQYPFDTTLGIGSLLHNGVLDRFPGLTFVLSHGGGAFPYLLGRFDVMHERMANTLSGSKVRHPPSDYAARFLYDTVVHDPRTLRYLGDMVGYSCLVLGTDEAFLPADLDPLANIAAAFPEQSVFDAISEGNARRVFTKLP